MGWLLFLAALLRPALGACPTNSTTAGYYCDGVGGATETICPAGYFCPRGANATTLCGPGTYGDTTGLSTGSCSGQCSAGRYGVGTSVRTAATCDGECPAGYFCPAGTSDPTQNLCACGYWGQLGARNSTCSGPCNAGAFGSTTSVRIAPTCTGLCAGGYFCPPVSCTANAQLCPIGTFCVPGSATSTPCPVGQWSNVTARGPQLGEIACFECTPGRYNPARGSTSVSACLPCAAGNFSMYGSPACTRCARGTYCLSGEQSAVPIDCPAGRYGDTIGLTSKDCTAPCPAGFYGSTPRLSSSSCTGVCPP